VGVRATRPLRLASCGAAPVTVRAARAEGEAAATVDLAGLPALPLALDPGAALTIEVGWTPAAPGPFAATLALELADERGAPLPAAIRLTGTGR
jgi:hypothetical protein